MSKDLDIQTLLDDHPHQTMESMNTYIHLKKNTGWNILAN